MSQIQGKILWQGTLDTTAHGSIDYTPDANTIALVTSIACVNTDTGTGTFNIYTQKAGTANFFNFRQVNIPLAAAGAAGSDFECCRDGKQIELSPGDTIFGDSSSSNKIQVTIFGIIIS